jgi:hypothetical protein
MRPPGIRINKNVARAAPSSGCRCAAETDTVF